MALADKWTKKKSCSNFALMLRASHRYRYAFHDVDSAIEHLEEALEYDIEDQDFATAAIKSNLGIVPRDRHSLKHQE